MATAIKYTRNENLEAFHHVVSQNPYELPIINKQ